MHLPKKKQIFEALLLLCLSLAVFGCYGGNGTQTVDDGASTTTISGYATKGPISGGAVTAYRTLKDGSKGTPIKSTTTAADGFYSMQVPASIGPVIVEVKGTPSATYVSESNGQLIRFTEAASFKAVVVPSTTTSQTPATISPLTEAAYQLTEKLIRDNPTASLESAVNAANQQVAVMHNIGDILSPPAVDQRYQAALIIVDQLVQSSVSPTSDQVMAMAQITTMISLAATINDTKYAEAIPAAVTTLVLASQDPASAVKPENLAGVADVAGAVANVPPAPTTITDTPPPTTPEILVTSSTPTSVTLSWSQSTGINVKYRIFRDGIYVATTSDLQFTDSSTDAGKIFPSTEYSYTVRAIDQAGKLSAVSAAKTVITKAKPADTVLPTKPGGITYLNLGYRSVDLSWGASTDDTGVVGYRIYRNGIVVTTVATPLYTDSTLSPETSYIYAVTAFDAADNESVKSDAVTVLTKATPSDTEAPAAPGNFTASAPVGAGEVRLAWSASTDNVGVAGYVIYRNGVTIASTTSLIYSDVTAAANTNYSYQIKARDAAGNFSVFSLAASVTTPPPPAPIVITVGGGLSQGILDLPPKDIVAPTAPLNLTATAAAISATSSSVSLSWSPSSDNYAVTGYEVYRNAIKIATVSQPGYTDLPVTSNTVYAYYIKAVDAAGNRSLASSQRLVTPNQTSLGVTVNGQVSPPML